VITPRAVCWSLLWLASAATLTAQRPTAVPVPSPSDSYAHVIVRGDTLIGLSRDLLIEPRQWRTVARRNRVRNPRRLRPGRVLEIPLPLMRSLPGDARVLWVRGQPRVEAADGTAVVALLATTIAPGSTIVTGDDEAVRLALSTGSTVTIGARARVELTELRTVGRTQVRRTAIDVQKGRVETTVAPATHPRQQFRVRTPVVTTAVRGTDFRVAVDDDTSVATEVTDGTVAVAQGVQDVALGAGFGARARAGQAFPVATRLLEAVAVREIPVATRLPARATWPALPGAVKYRARVTPAGADAPLPDLIVDRPEVTWADLPDGVHNVTLRGIDADGLEGFEASTPFSVDARPFPPIVRVPSDAGPTYGDQLTLGWARPTGVTSFDVQVAVDRSFTTPTFARVQHPGQSITVTLAPGTYVWRVASREGDDRGPWGDPVTVELRARPAAGPPPEALIDRKALTLRWSASPAGERYAVQVSADPAFGTLLADRTVATPELTMPRPVKGTYHVRVRLVNADDVAGPYGPTQAFDVPRPPRSKWWWLLLVPAGAGAVVAAS